MRPLVEADTRAPSPATPTPGQESVSLMTRREELEAALDGWRDAERRLETDTEDRERTRQEIARHRAEFMRLCAREVADTADPTSHPQAVT